MPATAGRARSTAPNTKPDTKPDNTAALRNKVALATVVLPGRDRPQAFLSLRECHEATGTSLPHWKNLVARGEVQVARIGRAVRIPASEFIRLTTASAVPQRKPGALT